MHRPPRRVAVFLFTLLLALPALARPAARSEGRAGSGLFAALWQYAASLLELAPNGATSKSRGTMDPDGAVTNATPPDDGESRGGMDPNG